MQCLLPADALFKSNQVMSTHLRLENNGTDPALMSDLLTSIFVRFALSHPCVVQL